jgi:hypothetical protein
MGGLLGGGGGGGLGGGGSGGGGFLEGLLGGLPDPLGLGKMLFGFGGDKGAPAQGQGGGQPMPEGMKFMAQPQSGVSQNPGQMYSSPMSPTGFGVGGGQR